MTWLETDFGSRNVLDFNVESNLDFDDSDFGFLDQLFEKTFSQGFQQPALDSMQTLPPQRRQQTCPERSRAPKEQVGVGAEAFRRSSLARWLPAQQDHTREDLHEFVALTSESGSPDTRLRVEPHPFCRPLELSSRDKVLAMMLGTCGGDKAATVAASFPPAQLLDDLVQNFITNHRSLSTAFIHMPTFQPNSEEPSLLSAIVASGAVLTEIKALQKLGFAIQEAIRVNLFQKCEADNAITRELWLLQSFMCTMEIGLWSGNKRKMELAESHPQALYTVSFLHADLLESILTLS